uniref:ASCH domain-containing protein n=1 Tax=Rhabditophanes sp. KR3021 TaxID=114890 RepID=A0AC35TRH3_9BILA
MQDHMFDYNESVELDKVLGEKEKTLKKVFDSTQEMIVRYKFYATEELAGNIEAILIEYFRDGNTNSDSDNPSLKIAYQMFPERNDEVAELISQDFLDANKHVDLR